MLKTQKSAQFCTTTHHVLSCDWCKCDGRLCGDISILITTHHVTNCDTKLYTFLYPEHYSYFISFKFWLAVEKQAVGPKVLKIFSYIKDRIKGKD